MHPSMKLSFWNTLGRQKQEFRPLKEGEVSLYTCGPTVYNFSHIGNLRAFLFDDLLRRVLEAAYRVKHVMNITDVGHLSSDADAGEDKLEKGARAEGRSVWEVANSYTEAFKSDMAELNILPPNAYQSQKYDDAYARATEFVPDQIKFVDKLLAGGFAYQTKQAIYFDVSKLPDYGKLSGQKREDKKQQVRDEVVGDSEKRNPQDFAVWFFTVNHFADHAMRWESPWGEGFPGWHLECSAIIHSVLGDPIDIHAGGVDHIGTHHPNEMAQTEGAFGHELANYWLHNEHILVNGEKMSKSAGNFYILRDIKEKNFPVLAYRFLVLQAHYRSQLNFTWDSLAAAAQAYSRLKENIARRLQPADAAARPEVLENIDSFYSKFTEIIADDLDSPKAIAELNVFIKNLPEQLNSQESENLASVLAKIDKILGLDLLKPAEEEQIPEEIRALAEERELSRKNQQFEQSDALRKKIEQLGYLVQDSASGPVLRRKND